MINTNRDFHYKTHMKKFILIIAFIILFLTSGCSRNTAVEPTSTPEASPTTGPTPTETATPIPTPTPSPQPHVRLENANTAFLNGDFDTARSEYKSAIEYSQDATIIGPARVKLGRMAYLSKDSTAALDYFRQVVDSDASDFTKSEAHFYLGLIYTDLQRYTDAAVEYGSYIELMPEPLGAYVYTLQGDAYANSAQPMLAAQAYQAAINQPGADIITLKIKIGQSLTAVNDYQTALNLYEEIFNTTTSDYVRAQVDLLVGQIYLQQGQSQLAYDRFLDAVNNYPRAYDSYSALVALVDNGVDVSDLNRGIVDYYAGQYGIAADVLKTYIDENPDHDGAAHYYRAWAFTKNEQYENAIAEWDALINDHPNDRFWSTAYDEKSYDQWYYFGRYDLATTTMLDFVQLAPQDSMAPFLLFEAGRTFERNDQLDESVTTWQRVADEYPNSDYAYMAIFFSGINRFRQNNYTDAFNYFQRAGALATDPTETAGAYFWMGKASKASGDDATAQSYWQQALKQDPTGYYSIRSRDLITGRDPYQGCKVLDLAVDLNKEIAGADAWMIQTFNLDPSTKFTEMGALLADTRLQRAAEYWRLGLFDQSRNEVSSYRTEKETDPLIQYQLGRWLLEMGMNREAILAERQVLSLAGLDDNGTLSAPIYFNHVRFGPYFKEYVLKAANETGLDPLLIYSVIRQESLFEPFIVSSAGAEGLMQMMPATAREVSSQSGWPPVFLDDDIFRPQVAISLGSYFLDQQIRLQGGNTFAGLAAYNGGMGNASAWLERSQGDNDLYLEVVRYKETRDYLRAILEQFNLYKTYYCR